MKVFRKSFFKDFKTDTKEGDCLCVDVFFCFSQ